MKIEINKRLIKIVICILMICTVLTISGCMPDKEKEKFERVETQAVSNAKNYIKEKYGFDAEVVTVDGEINANGSLFYATSTGYANVTLKYDGKEFNVHILGEEETTKGRDNYQAEIIYADMKNKINPLVDIDAEDMCIDIYYGGETNKNIMTSIYYNGENLDEIVQDLDVSIRYKISTLNADLENCDTESIKTNLGEFKEILILNCDNSEDFQQVKDAEIIQFSRDLKKYVICVDDYVMINESSTEYIDIEKTTYDGFIVCRDNGSYCEVTADSCDPKEWIGNGYHEEPKQVFGAYSIDTDADKIYLYIDVNELDTEDYDEATIALSYVKNGDRHYGNGILTEVIDNKYLTICRNYESDLLFTVLAD